MKVLVTGAAGFIGYHVAQALLARGDTVIGVDALTPYYDTGLKKARLDKLQSKQFTFIQADITDKEAMHALFAKHQFDKVCHLAAQAGIRYALQDPYTYNQTNTLGTLILLEQCRVHIINHFVYASSSSVYGDSDHYPSSESDRTDTPVSVYAATKKYNEVLAHTYYKLWGIQCTGLRFFTVYGPFMRPDLAPFKFVQSVFTGDPIEIHNHGKHKRDFTYIADIVQGVVASLDKPLGYEIINLAYGQSVELMEFVRIIEQEAGREANKRMLAKQPGDVEITSADISKARQLLGYTPKTDIRQGMKAFIAWYREFYKQ